MWYVWFEWEKDPRSAEPRSADQGKKAQLEPGPESQKATIQRARTQKSSEIEIQWGISSASEQPVSQWASDSMNQWRPGEPGKKYR